MVDRSLSVGELAARTGITVRTLHHYEDLGLLVAGRSAAGHRRYGAAELARLQGILSLRRLGLPLGEIRELLAKPDVGGAMFAFMGKAMALLK